MEYHNSLEALIGLNFNEQLFDKLEESIKRSTIMMNDTCCQSNEHVIVRYLERAFYIMQNIYTNKCDGNIDKMTTAQRKNIVDLLQFIISISLLPNLIPGIGLSLEFRRTNIALDFVDEEQKYKNLSFVVTGLIKLTDIKDIKSIILTNHLGDLLAGLYQLSFAPLQKPNTVNNKSNFIMTEDFYHFIVNNRVNHKLQLTELLKSTNRIKLFQQLMLLLYRKNKILPPLFFRKLITAQLGIMLTEHEGLKSLIRSFIYEKKFDSGTHWNKINMIVKLVTTKQMHMTEDEYFKNISNQISDLLLFGIINKDTVYAITCVACIYELYKHSALEIYAHSIVQNIVEPLKKLQSVTYEHSVTRKTEIELTLETLHFCFIQESQVKLEINKLTNIRNILFNIYVYWPYNELRNKVEDLIYLFIFKQKLDSNIDVFDSFFDEVTSATLKKNIALMNSVNSTNNHSSIEALIMLLELKKSDILLYQLFVYILHKLSEIYENKDDLSKKLMLGETLSTLSEKAAIQQMLVKEPHHLVEFIKTVLRNRIKTGKCNNYANENIIMCLVLLNGIIADCNHHILQGLIKPLNDLKLLCISEEINILLNELDITIGSRLQNSDPHIISSEKTPTRCRQALADVCDPLLPVRAHGLMELGKLFIEKDQEAIAKRPYVLCVLQENLKHEDSYIYLAAINALANIAKVCTDEVIELLTQEYLSNKKFETSRESNSEIRLKVGEVLVKIISSIGSRIHDFKSILLNTFLEATHDEDFLVRSSGFSNLGELCKVVGNAIGPEVITQIMCQVEFCIDNEKSPEVRRSSILLCTQLLRGLQEDKSVKMHNNGLILLKPALTPLLRALKKSYEDDPDSTLKLHAQLAIEELERVVKEYLKYKLEEKCNA